VNGRIALLLAVLTFACVAPAFGGTVTLREAVERALENNQLLKAASFERSAADEASSASRSRYFPSVSLQSGAGLSTTPSRVFMMKLDEGRINPDKDFSANKLNHPNPRGDFQSALILEQPLLDFSISTGARIAAKEAEAASLSLEARREEMAYRVYLAYLDVRKGAAYVEVAGQAVADAREHARLAGVREKEGIGLTSDRLRTSTELSEAEQRLLTAKNDLLLARLRLNLVVGGEPNTPLDIAGSPALPGPLPPEAELAAVAQKSRPDLKLAEKGVEKGALAVRQAIVAYLPTVYASASYQVNDRDNPFGRDNDSWNLGVSLRWELFDGNRRSHEKLRAEMTRNAAAAILENGRREVALQVTESLLRRQEAEARLEAARLSVTDGVEALRLVSLRYRNGLSTMVELLDAEAALNRSRANLVEVENQVAGTTAEIYFRAGVLLKEVMR
jgi:outer membrane protein